MARLRSYLVRATYDWLVECDLTPYFLVDVTHDEVEVPWDYVEDNKIVLNVAPVAIRGLQMEAEFVSFEASFSGQAWQIYIPMKALIGVYARENGQGVYARENGLGMLVNEGEHEDDLDPIAEKGPKLAVTDKKGAPAKENKSGKKPGLRIVK